MPDATLDKRIPPMLSTANFGRRLCATFIDLILLTVLIFFLRISFPDFSHILFFKKATPFVIDNITHWDLSKSSLIGTWIIYSIIMDCTTVQGTFGKQMMQIIVTDDRGNRITILRSFRRNLFKIISYAIAGLGFLNILFDKRNRSWHDKLANTLVIYKTY